MSDPESTVPYGYCHCGCGERTTIIRWNSATRGLVAGEPRKFIQGHQRTSVPRPGPLHTVTDCGYSTPCWVWNGAKLKAGGYGALTRNGQPQRAHRWMYELKVGPIPEGLQLDHLCRNRACVNPDHLEPVTQAENIRRGDGASALNARKTHCKRGHEFDEENTRMENGKRQCRKCDAIRRARRKR